MMILWELEAETSGTDLGMGLASFCLGVYGSMSVSARQGFCSIASNDVK